MTSVPARSVKDAPVREGVAHFLAREFRLSLGEEIASRTPRILLYAITALVVLIIAWACVAPVDRVVRAAGRLVPASDAQMVQHLEGGIVGAILVKEGDTVAAGQPIILLDTTRFNAERDEGQVRLIGLKAKAARLAAEADGRETFEAPHDIGLNEPVFLNELAGFLAQRERQERTIAVLREQLIQRRAELDELLVKQRGVNSELEVNEQQLKVVEDLFGKKAASQLELLEARGRRQQLQTELRLAYAAEPRTRAAARELEQKIDEATSQFRSDARLKLTEVNVEIARLEKEQMTGNDRVERAVVRAPMAGVINRLFFNTVGGVIKPGDTVVEITPIDAPVLLEAQIAPKDRADLRPGGTALVRISAFDYTSYGILRGIVSDISPDTVVDKEGNRFYRIKVTIEPESLKRFRAELLPGLTATADLVVGERTVMQYIIAPVLHVSSNAFRDGK